MLECKQLEIEPALVCLYLYIIHQVLNYIMFVSVFTMCRRIWCTAARLHRHNTFHSHSLSHSPHTHSRSSWFMRSIVCSICECAICTLESNRVKLSKRPEKLRQVNKQGRLSTFNSILILIKVLIIVQLYIWFVEFILPRLKVFEWGLGWGVSSVMCSAILSLSSHHNLSKRTVWNHFASGTCNWSDVIRYVWSLWNEMNEYSAERLPSSHIKNKLEKLSLSFIDPELPVEWRKIFIDKKRGTENYRCLTQRGTFLLLFHFF